MAKILTIDIETSPAKAFVWGTFKQNIAISQIIEPTRMISYSAKWLGGKQETHGEWEYEDRYYFILRLHELLEEADIVVTYNGKTFDIPHINREFLLLGLTPPAPYGHVDLYQIVRSKFRFQSGKLEWVVKTLELDRKMATGGFELWVKVLEGDAAAQRKMLRYNAHDVKITELLYTELRPWITVGPNVAIIDGLVHACPRCASTDVQKRGVARTSVSTFQRYQCNHCGAWSRGGKALARTELR